jgi:GTPase
VEAFQATLQEAADADLLLHVVDAANPAVFDQMLEVERVLADIGAGDIPQIIVFNKLDRLPSSQQPRAEVDALERPGLDGGGLQAPGQRVPRVFVSALDGRGLAALRTLLAAAVHERSEGLGLETKAESPHIPSLANPSSA